MANLKSLTISNFLKTYTSPIFKMEPRKQKGEIVSFRTGTNADTKHITKYSTADLISVTQSNRQTYAPQPQHQVVDSFRVTEEQPTALDFNSRRNSRTENNTYSFNKIILLYSMCKNTGRNTELVVVDQKQKRKTGRK